MGRLKMEGLAKVRIQAREEQSGRLLPAVCTHARSVTDVLLELDGSHSIFRTSRLKMGFLNIGVQAALCYPGQHEKDCL